MKVYLKSFLILCFLCSLSFGVVTSCDKDNDSNVELSTIEQGRADGKAFGDAYKELKGDGDATMKTSAALKLLSLSSNYKNSTDKAYQTAFAEAAVEIVTGTADKGDAAVEKLNEILKGLSDLESYKDILTNGNATEKANVITQLLQLFSK